jgi:uncharacterized membrane protein YeaQ/YmgE (transglycosylase-associated protein family)
MTLETIVIWIIVGALAGILADAAVSRMRLSLMEAIVVGIVGAFIGGWLFDALGISVGTGLLPLILTAFVGAVIFLLLVAGLRRAR